MSEEKTELLKVDSTNPLPLETLFNQFAAMMMNRFDRLEAQYNESHQQFIERFAQVDERFAEINERLAKAEKEQIQTNLELRMLNTSLSKMEESMADLDYKVDSFIREQVKIKRDVAKLQEAVGFKVGLDRRQEVTTNG